jgi:subtilisin family serine protease
MATPHVSGLAAKLWQSNATTTRTYLQELAENHDLCTEGDDTATGFGLPIAT